MHQLYERGVPSEIKIIKQSGVSKRETWGPHKIKIMKQNGVRKRGTWDPRVRERDLGSAE